jgi:virginiamycin B lyase
VGVPPHLTAKPLFVALPPPDPIYAITYLDGAIWYAETGVKPNTLVRFDLATQKFQSWGIPSGGGVIRNMMPTRDRNIVMAESGIDKIALAVIARPAD